VTAVDRIADRTELESALSGGRFLLFKHSRICPTSDRAFGAYRRFVEGHPDVPTGWIDVIAQRPWSQEVAATTGVRHESPQALLLEGGRVVWHASHFAITESALKAAWETAG